MKKQLYIFGTAMVAMVFLLSGCSITKRHYSPGYHVEWHKSGGNHLAKEEVSKDLKNGKEEELIVHSHEESKQLASKYMRNYGSSVVFGRVIRKCRPKINNHKTEM